LTEKILTKTILPLNYQTYLSFIEGSVGTAAYRHAYARVNDEKRDLVENGKLSCAFFVSSVLVVFNWLGKIHVTVKGTVIELEKSGWIKIEDLRPGAVLVWEAQEASEGHNHIGFYLKDDRAVSNSSETGLVSEHHFTYGQEEGRPKRKIEAIYWNPKFEL